MKSVRDHVVMFGEYTSMHGFSRIVDSKQLPKRMAWIILFATAWTFFTVQMSMVLKDYFDYPKQVSTELVHGGAPFPAITLCNLGSFDFYSIYRLNKSLPSIAKYYETKSRIPTYAASNEEKKSHDDDNEDDENYGDNDSDGEEIRRNIDYANETFATVMAKFYNLAYMNYRSSSIKPGDWEEIIDRLFSRTTISANVPPQMLQANGLKEKEFIVKCTYKKKPCKLKRFFDPYFFNCYTFTPPNSTADPRQKSSLSEGIESGFSVMLLAGSRMLREEKMLKGFTIPGLYARDSLLSGAGGIRVVIHTPGTKPFPLTEGYDVPPGMMASLGVSPKRRKRLGKPYGDCTKEYPFLKSEEQTLAGPYRRIACEKICIQKRIYEKCNCHANTLPTEVDLLTKIDRKEVIETEPLCARDFKYVKPVACANLTQMSKDSKQCPKKVEKCSGTHDFRRCFRALSAKEANCSDAVLMKLYDKMLCADRVQELLSSNKTMLDECGCYPSCDEVHYDASYSLSQWPSLGLDGDNVAGEIFDELQFVNKFTCNDKRIMFKEHKDSDVKRALKDFSKINVYISDTNVLITSESPAVTFTQLVSDIGGQFGIWIGVSMITLAEVLEMFTLIIMDCCRKRLQNWKSEKIEKITL